MTPRPEAILEAAGLRVVFLRQADRIAHRVEIADPSGAFAAVLESVEGTPAELWPPSPPLQEAHVEHRGAQQVALLVGMAGSSHWSLSVELDPATKSIKFDAACRARSVAEFLGSTYRTLQASQPDLPAYEIISPLAVERAADALTIRAELAEVKLPATVCWRYELRKLGA